MADVVKGPVDLPQDLQSTSLDDKYDLTKRRIFVSGPQAIVRLPLMQKELDRRAGLTTAGFISGYRGPPAAGRPRPELIARQAPSPCRGIPVAAGPQRESRGDRHMGGATGRDARGG